MASETNAADEVAKEMATLVAALQVIKAEKAEAIREGAKENFQFLGIPELIAEYDSGFCGTLRLYMTKDQPTLHCACTFREICVTLTLRGPCPGRTHLFEVSDCRFNDTYKSECDWRAYVSKSGWRSNGCCANTTKDPWEYLQWMIRYADAGRNPFFTMGAKGVYHCPPGDNASTLRFEHDGVKFYIGKQAFDIDGTRHEWINGVRTTVPTKIICADLRVWSRLYCCCGLQPPACPM